MKYIFGVFVFLLSINHCLAGTSEEQEIRSVIKAFDESIQSKNKELFLGLFLEEGVSWVGVFSDKVMKERIALVNELNKKENKNIKVTRMFLSSPQEFIETVLSEDVSSREEFNNIKIHSDGNIATVFFDYTFYKGDQKQNWGSESWQLVQTVKGWKIQAVSFSINTD